MQRHDAMIDTVLARINAIPDAPFVLKGDTALMKCYGLDRYSEDIDLDCPGQGSAGYRESLAEALESLSPG
jgi:predicted nucleotidyltransferase component of viral defense system